MELCGCNVFSHYPPCLQPAPPCCPEREGPDLLAASNSTSQAVLGGTGPIPFEKNDLVAGRAVSHEAGSGIFVIHCPGLYQIQYHTLAGAVSRFYPIQAATILQVGPYQLDGTYDQGTLTAQLLSVTLGGMAVIRVTETPTTVSLLNLATPVQYYASALIIQRLS